MNVILAPPTRAGLWERYVQLAPGPKQLMRFKSMIVPAATRAQFADCVIRSGLRASEGRTVWAARSVQATLDGLINQGLLTDAQECPPALLHSVAADAAASPDAAAMAAAIRNSSPTHGAFFLRPSDLDIAPLSRLIRLSAYLNDEAGFIKDSTFCNSVFGPHATVIILANIFHDVPLPADWLASRHAVIQAPLLEARLTSFIVTGVADPEMQATIELYRQRRDLDGFRRHAGPASAPRPARRAAGRCAGRVDGDRRSPRRRQAGAGTARSHSWKGATRRRCGHYREALKGAASVSPGASCSWSMSTGSCS